MLTVQEANARIAVLGMGLEKGEKTGQVGEFES